MRTPPPPVGLVSVHWGYCAASGFNADGTIAGVCTYSYGSAQRFHSSPTVNYLTTWGPYGQIVGLGAQCTACSRNYQGTGTVVMISGVPYYYVATNATNGNQLVSSNVTSYLALQTLPAVPAAPTVSAVLASDYVQVSWTPDPNTQSAITPSVVTVAPAAGFSVPTLTSTVNNTVTTVTLGQLQPLTTYTVSVVSVDAVGSSPAGSVSISTLASTIVPGAPTITYMWWTGAYLAFRWTVPTSGDSPIDAYQVQVTLLDGESPSGPIIQTVSPQTLSAYIALDGNSVWRAQVRAHNAAGWGAWAERIWGGL